ncbi:MAG TPA: hypothetical protein VKV29_00080 [Chthonomonas sp.]|nr:hypothetical protein [Chthonomonas sp.]
MLFIGTGLILFLDGLDTATLRTIHVRPVTLTAKTLRMLMGMQSLAH